jgi:hypothetical protein
MRASSCIEHLDLFGVTATPPAFLGRVDRSPTDSSAKHASIFELLNSMKKARHEVHAELFCLSNPSSLA